MPTHASTYHWFIKYKLYHIPFWFAYHYMWWSITVGDPFTVASSMFVTPYAIKNMFYVIFQALGVYFNLYYLLPRFLEKGRYITYITLVLCVIIFTAACIVPGYYISAALSGRDFYELYGIRPEAYLHFFQINTLPSTAASMTLAMSVKLTKNWIQSKRREQLLEKEKLETELKFLKYQFNPHFLFNTINSIFFLIHKNPDMASDSLAKFSELLRHQLYESNDRQIPLSKEINYLENFIELEKLRQNKNVEVLSHICHPHTNQVGIAPFILMTFIENAFKHVSKNAESINRINITLELKEQELHFTVSNTKTEVYSKEVVHYGGIGLQNVKRRLDLLYPGQYQLDIQNTVTNFTVHLVIKLALFTAAVNNGVYTDGKKQNDPE